MYKFLIIAILTLSPIWGYATCTQKNLAGTWHDYAVTSASVAECSFKIDAKGKINPSSICTNYTAKADLPSLNITSGEFKLSKLCSISGNIGVNTTPMVFFKGQLDQSKLSFTGISRNSSGNVVMHHFVKE
jgi:hypothetical protein